MYAGGYPAAASTSSGFQRSGYRHHAHAQPIPQHPAARGGAAMLPHSAAPASAAGMHMGLMAVPQHAMAAGVQPHVQPPPPPGSSGSAAGLVLGAPLLHQGGQHLAASAGGVLDAGAALVGAAPNVSMMHQQSGGMVPAGGSALTGNAGLGLNVPGGAVQGQQGDRAGW
jgi:hypothetical protein